MFLKQKSRTIFNITKKLDTIYDVFLWEEIYKFSFIETLFQLINLPIFIIREVYSYFIYI